MNVVRCSFWFCVGNDRPGHAPYCRCRTRPYGLMSLLERPLTPRQASWRACAAPPTDLHWILGRPGEWLKGKRSCDECSVPHACVNMCANLPGHFSPRWYRAVRCSLQRVPPLYSPGNHSNYLHISEEPCVANGAVSERGPQL